MRLVGAVSVGKCGIVGLRNNPRPSRLFSTPVTRRSPASLHWDGVVRSPPGTERAGIVVGAAPKLFVYVDPKFGLGQRPVEPCSADIVAGPRRPSGL